MSTRVGGDPYEGHTVNRLWVLVFVDSEGNEGLVGMGSAAAGIGAAAVSTESAAAKLRREGPMLASTMPKGARLVMREFSQNAVVADETLVAT